MSGQKISSFEIEANRRAELERQRLERLRKIEVALSGYHNCILNYQTLKREILSLTNKLTSMDIDSSKNYEKSFRGFLSEIDKHINQEVPIEPDDITSLTSNMIARFDSLNQRFDYNCGNLQKSIEMEKNVRKDQERRKNIYASFEVDQGQEEIIHIDFSFVQNLAENEQEEIIKNFEEMINECRNLINNDSVVGNNRKRLINLLYDIKKNHDNPKALEILLGQFKTIEGQISYEARLFGELYIHYRAIHSDIKRMRKNTPILLKAKSAFSNLKMLEEEVANSEKIAISENERMAIKRELDDVMTSLGYDIADTITMRSVTKGEHLFFGSDSAPNLHIYLSDTKDIMIETVSLSEFDEDENADFNCSISHNISDEDRSYSLEMQKSLCMNQFPKIIEAMAKRGYKMTNISKKPIDAKYTKKLKIKGKRPTLITPTKETTISSDTKKTLTIN